LYDTAAHENGKPFFSLTVADFFNAPEIHKIDLANYSGSVGD